MLLGANDLFLADFPHFIDEFLKIVDESSRVLDSQRIEQAFDLFLWNYKEARTHILQSSIEISLITYPQVVNQNFIGVQDFNVFSIIPIEKSSIPKPSTKSNVLIVLVLSFFNYAWHDQKQIQILSPWSKWTPKQNGASADAGSPL